MKYYLKINNKKVKIVILLLISCSAMVAWAYGAGILFPSRIADESTINEGPISKVVVTAGPFDIHRRYLSMEGPFVSMELTAGDLIESGNIECPEGMVNFIENGAKPAGMMGTASNETAVKNQVVAHEPIGLIHDRSPSPELYWFKGVKLEVLDENGVVQPTAEFICHWNLDVDPNFRNKIFTEGHRTVNSRLSSISQGETTQILPVGYGVPIASNETLHLSFQAANRTTDVHRRVKHRCTLYFVKDKDLIYPIKALYFYVPYITVVVDKNTPQLSDVQKQSCAVCIGASEGVDAPNDKAGGTFHDPQGRVLSGHWVIPPGEHTYRDLVSATRDKDFQKGSPVIRAAWTHVHPLCTKFSLVECAGSKRTDVLAAHCVTKTEPGLQIMHLDFLTPNGGAKLDESSEYELEVTYNNTLPKAVDSMASMGIYMEDLSFGRPKWALHDYKPDNSANTTDSNSAQSQQSQMSCAITNRQCKSRAGNSATETSLKDDDNSYSSARVPDRKTFPLFDSVHDGPLLHKNQSLEISTSKGPIEIILQPELAPKTCTHLFQLMKMGCCEGTRFFDYQPDQFLVTAQMSDKHAGYKPLTSVQIQYLRRLPLETSVKGKHVPLALALCRDADDADSGTDAICIVLNTIRHLDGRYTIFGHVVPDKKSIKTLQAIESSWNDPSGKPYIIGCHIK